MLKYYNAMVVFEEIPNEIALAINITNCPCHCPGCHSKFLWEDVGTELTSDEIDALIEKNEGITCVCLMGGDKTPELINTLAEYIHEAKGLKTGWYSGKDELSDKIDLKWFNYVKIGHYDEKLGPLNKETTNQRLYLIEDKKPKDITYKFWKKRDQ